MFMEQLKLLWGCKVSGPTLYLAPELNQNQLPNQKVLANSISKKIIFDTEWNVLSFL